MLSLSHEFRTVTFPAKRVSLDHGRWTAAAATMKSSAKKESTSPPSNQVPPPVDRYKYDMMQAEAMRAKLRRPSESRQGRVEEEDDVRLGLRGLDEADALQERGELKEALRLYELSIDLLLRFLRENSPKKKDNYDSGTISERVSVALSEAESLKQRMSQVSTGRAQSAAEPSTETPRRATSKSAFSFESLTSSLASALAREDKAISSPREDRKVQASSPRRRSRLDYVNDPLVRSIKNDIYVDPSELQSTSWEDIAGLERAKQSLQESAIMPLVRPDLFTGLRKPQNILLYGPPGTGKTMLVRAVAHKSSCLLFVCTASSLMSKWHGEGEKLVRTLFQMARDVAPSIIFVDELDALLSSRRSESEHEASRRFKTEFMVQMDGITGNDSSEELVLVLGCTNCPWDVDEAVLRRFPRRIPIPLPDSKARTAMFQMLLKKVGRHNVTSRQIRQLVKRTDGFSCSDIRGIASEASFGPIRSLGGVDAIKNVRASAIRPVSMEDFEEAIRQSTKSVTPALLAKYQQWEQQQAAA
jgi:ATP-dependent 26S proteasome regulatory subunit